MRANLWLVLSLCLATVGGCASKDKEAISNLPASQADRLNAEHSRFETVQDPPFTADTHFAAGQLAESQSAFRQAITQYEAAVKLEPMHKMALFRLGVLYARFREYPKAIEAWQRYIKACDHDPTAYSNLAFCYEIAGRLDDAEKTFKQGLARDPRNAACRVNYGLMLARHGRTEEAMTQLGVVLSPPEVHYNLASLYEQMGRKDLARSQYQAALQLDPNHQAARTRLAALK